MGSAKGFLGATAALLIGLGALLGVRAALGNDADGTVLRVVGDSFPEQAKDQLLALAEAEGVDADISAFGGTSICSWWEPIETYIAEEPDILVVAFAGNDIHPCITDDPEQHRPGDVVADLYREDLERVLEMVDHSKTQVYVVLPPPVGLPRFEGRAAAMRDMYRAAADDHPELAVVDSATHLDPEGRGFQPTLPCEAWDVQDHCVDGEIQVREEDVIHLTPAGGERYARAIATAVGIAAS